MMNNQKRTPNTFWTLNMLANVWLYLLLLGFPIWGCSTSSTPKSQPDQDLIQDTGTQINQTFTQLPEEASRKEPRDQTSTTKLEKITFQEQKQGSCLLLIPAPNKAQVQAGYEHPELRLEFSTPIPKPDLAKIPKSCPIQSIDFLPQDSQNISALRLKLSQPVQFLVSHSEPGQVRLSLISNSRLQTDRDTNTAQDKQDKPSEPSPKLQDLDYSLDQDRQLRIILEATKPIQYQPLPQKEREIKIILPQLEVPEALDKFYNLNKFQAAAKSLWLQEADSGTELRVSLKQRVPFNLERKGNQLLITFQDIASPKQEKDPGLETDQKLEQAKAGNRKTRISPEQIPSPETDTMLQGAGLDSPEVFPGLQENYQGEPISIDLQDAEIEHVLRLIAEVGDFNLILDEDVQGKISLKLIKVPWDQALDLVLMQKDLGRVRKGNIMRISTAKKLENERQRIIQARKSALEAQKSQEEIAPLQTEYIQINYATAAQLEPQVSSFLSKRGQVSVDSRTNQLIVSDTAEKLDQIQGVTQKLDRPERQVLIQARLVYATDNFQRGLGMRWGGEYSGSARGGDLEYGVSPTSDGYMVNLPQEGQATFGLGAFVQKLSGTDMFALDAQLSLGEEQGQAQTISSPRVLTLTNQKAEIEQGTRIRTEKLDEAGNTLTEYVDALLKLVVTPQITPDNRILLDLDITDDNKGTGDDIETRRTQTKLMVENGQTIVLGGVQQVREQSSRGRVPGLAKLPLLGNLFKNNYQEQRKDELLIFIQPRILETR
ncbi:MAG: type IV pilus secretin PilQ [Desulfohalobiaceae bacterium]